MDVDLLEEPALVVNATPVGLDDLVITPEHLSPPSAWVDIRTRPRPVDTVVAARDRHLPAMDGREMLLRQAVLSFTQWTGCTPSLDAVRTALHREMST